MATSWPTHRGRARKQRQYVRYLRRQQMLARRAARRSKASHPEAARA